MHHNNIYQSDPVIHKLMITSIMRASNIIAICHLGTIMKASSAFQHPPINIVKRQTSSSSSLVLLSAHHPFNHYRQYHHQRPAATPLSSTVDAEVLTEADELLNEQFHDHDAADGGWNQRRAMKDFRSTKEFRTAGATDPSSTSSNNSGGSGSSFGFKRESEVINFDPEQPIFKPLKYADEHGYGYGYGYREDPFAEQFDDFSKFQREQNAKQQRRNHHQQQHFPPPHHRQHRRHHPDMMPPPPPMGMPEFEFTKVHFDNMPPPPPPPHHMMPPLDMPPPHFFNGPFMSENDNNNNNMPPQSNEDDTYVDRVNFADHGRPVNDRDNTGSVDTFFSDRPAKNTAQPPRGGGSRGRRGGPSVYTPEEEELIASMGGMGRQPPPPPPPPPQSRPSTQEFAEAGKFGWMEPCVFRKYLILVLLPLLKKCRLKQTT